MTELGNSGRTVSQNRSSFKKSMAYLIYIMSTTCIVPDTLDNVMKLVVDLCQSRYARQYILQKLQPFCPGKICVCKIVSQNTLQVLCIINILMRFSYKQDMF